MSRKVNKLEHSHVEVICTVEKQDWKKAQDNAFKKGSANVQVPGFRKGKAPENLVKSKVDQVKVMNEAIDALLPKLYREIIEEEKIQPYAQPKVDVTKLTQDELEVKFTIVTAPEIKLGKYTGLNIGKETIEVTDKDINDRIDEMLKNSGSLLVKEGKAEEGDTVVMDFKGKVDGKLFDGGSAENYELVLGSKSFIPGFEDQLIGHAAGEQVEVKVKFPEQYTEELKGKDATFDCLIHEVKTKKPASLDDEFVKDQGINGVNTVDELKAHVKSNIQSEKERNARSAYFDKLLTEIIKDSKIDIPDEIVDSQFASRKEEFINRMKQSGLTVEQYLQILGQTQEQLDAQLRENASKEVTNYLVLEAVGEAEKMNDISEKDVEFEMSKLAEQYKMTLDQVKKTLEPNLDSFKNSIKMNRIDAFLYNNNN